MNPKNILTLALFALLLSACGGQTSSTATEIVAPKASFTPISINTPTLTSTTTPIPSPTQSSGLPDSVTVDGNKITFDDWELSVTLPSDQWKFQPDMYLKTSDFDGFTFIRYPGFTDETGHEYRPSLGIFFYAIPANFDLINFSLTLRANLGDSFPKTDSTFGFDGIEPVLNIDGIGYYGNENEYSTYIIHSVHGTTGVQISLEMVEPLLEEVRPEFYEIMQSLEFTENK